MGERRNAELGEFLRTRRSRLEPHKVGLSVTSRRRVPGLRREELAEIAGVSPDYYTRLEQGRHPTASSGVLDALARALRLSTDEREHLYNLAQVVDAKPSQIPSTTDPSALDHMLDVFGHTPAVLCGPFSDILAANDAACFLYDTDFGGLPAAERNSIHWILTTPTARALYGESWEEAATEMVGKLRMETGQRPSHPRARALVAQLNRESSLFRHVWRQHEISTCVQGVKTLHHRLGGEVRLRSEAMTVHSSQGQVFYLMLPVDAAFQVAYASYAAGR
ncbi:helix-turn-helix transcriptional regulator [Actinoallomurus iriomotensis]|uniref:Transcriptional regulator n=1 Tax=Actinoallomurus iriomotensis TaxID=478107 RepID=A0A9W6S155_9ACTN|nr:helix-turn-helix transcriptional regulator [Actinoallomurus iriomotensis]GLY83747.1 transcriptional regulator [Actinoallomurus iriomotensis]